MNIPLRTVSLKAFANAKQVFRDSTYQRYNARRLEHLASLGLDLTQKSVLELGAGIGDLTTFFLDRGCSVTSLEPRAENCALFAEMLAFYPGKKATIFQADVETLDGTVPGEFDIVFAYGILYHLANPAKALQDMAKKTAGILLIETKIWPDAEEIVALAREDAVDPSNAFHGVGCRPTSAWLRRELSRLFPFVYAPRINPFHEEFPKERAILIASRHQLSQATVCPCSP